MEQNVAKNVAPPEGFKIVIGDAIQSGDMVWNESEVRWEVASPKMIRDDVDAYHGVARKA